MELQVRNGVVLVSSEDYDELAKFGWTIGRPGYASRDKHHTVRTMHRVVALRMGLTIDGCDVDHIDGNKSNYQRENLRVCSRAQNVQNSRLKSNNKSGYKGVSWSKGMKKWEARIMAFGHLRVLGYSEDPAIAGEMYRKAATELHGEFARY